MDRIIKDCALIFEGGGMRAAYSAGVVSVLIENNIQFEKSYGVSAACTLISNYILKDAIRNKKCFVDIVKDEHFGGFKSFVKGKGYFNSNWIYGPDMDQRPEGLVNLINTMEADHFEEEYFDKGLRSKYETALSLIPFDYESFMNAPQDFLIGAYCVEDAQTVYWSKKDVKSLDDFMIKSKASSSLPVFMPSVVIDGKHYIDGGVENGLLIDQAIKDSFSKFFVVRTREDSYVRNPLTRFQKSALKVLYRKYPNVIRDAKLRYIKYNYSVVKIKELERQGMAYTFYPEKVELDNKTMDYDKLNRAYEVAYKQATRELPKIKEFLGL